ncbi:MAG: lytic murein transglycosylase [Alphaproteobacteria bacterium]|nr:lytic murein transglycosylase [Alphaproteobacteria bacterium]
MLLLLSACAGGIAGDPQLALWKREFFSEAREKGISHRTLETALADFTPIPRIVELDRAQPERTKSFEKYVTRLLSPARINEGRELLAAHRGMLERIGAEYGVQPRFIVALWGIETNYGKNMGSYPVPWSLATLAYDGRRGEFFRSELMQSLAIIDAGHIAFEDMNGSWAGAMGQCQFMPSSFQRFAVDHNGDGRKDIWNTQEDIFASIAHYLSASGWDEDTNWGRRVKLPSHFDKKLVESKTAKTLAEWQVMGVRQWDGAALPQHAGLKATVVLPDNKTDRAYLAYDNYRVLLKWNRSTYFATAVGLLADHIASKG